MRRFFYDTEFIEDGTTIDLVSIGVVDVAGESGGRRTRARRSQSAGGSGGAGTGEITVPMQGTIVKVLVDVG